MRQHLNAGSIVNAYTAMLFRCTAKQLRSWASSVADCECQLPTGRNTLEHKPKVCAMGVFRSQTPRAYQRDSMKQKQENPSKNCLKPPNPRFLVNLKSRLTFHFSTYFFSWLFNCRLIFYVDFFSLKNPPEKVDSFFQLTFSKYKLTLWLFTPERATLRSYTIKKIYHRKLWWIPTLSRYFCLAASLSSSVGAVLYFTYNSRLTMDSNFLSNPCLISGKTSSRSARWYFSSA